MGKKTKKEILKRKLFCTIVILELSTTITKKPFCVLTQHVVFMKCFILEIFLKSCRIMVVGKAFSNPLPDVKERGKSMNLNTHQNMNTQLLKRSNSLVDVTFWSDITYAYESNVFCWIRYVRSSFMDVHE